MHKVAWLLFKGSSSEEHLTFTHHHGKIMPYAPPYSPIIHYCPVYRVYLPFYRVKNPISPSLPYVFRLTPILPYPHHSMAFTKEVPLFYEHWCGRSDPSNPSESRRYSRFYYLLFLEHTRIFNDLLSVLQWFVSWHEVSFDRNKVCFDRTSSLLATSCGRSPSPSKPWFLEFPQNQDFPPPSATPPKTPPRAHSKRRIFRCNFAIPRATPFFAHFSPPKMPFLPHFVPSPCHVMPWYHTLTSFMPWLMLSSSIIIMLWCYVIIIMITLSSSSSWWTILLHEVW